MADIVVTHEERIVILEAIAVRLMLQKGFELKGSTNHEVKDGAKKQGLDPEKTLIVFWDLVDSFVKQARK